MSTSKKTLDLLAQELEKVNATLWAPKGGKGVKSKEAKEVGVVELTKIANCLASALNATKAILEDIQGDEEKKAKRMEVMESKLAEDGQEEQRGGEAVEAGRRPRRPQPPEVSERQVLHHRRQGEQGDQIRERIRGGGDLSCEARGGAGGDEAGGQSGEGGYQVLPSHQVRADPSVLGLQDWISLRPGCQRGEAGQGKTIEGDLHQLCVDEQTSLHPLRGAPARQGEDVGEVLRRQRRHHLRPAEGELRQLGLRQGEADFSERRSCLGRGRRSQPQQHRVDGDSRRGEVTVLQQLEDSKNLQIVIPTFVPEAWYSIPSLSSEFGKMLAPCMPLISKPQISKNMVAKLKLKGQDDDVDDNVDDDVDDHDDDDVGQAYQLGMMMGAEINV